MMKRNSYKRQIMLAGGALMALACHAGIGAYFPMDINNGEIRETGSGTAFAVSGNFSAEPKEGVKGGAVLFDGYSTYVDARLDNLFPMGTPSMTFSLWAAVPCYPIVEIDVNTKEKAPIATCLDETAKTGFGFYIGIDGKVEFRTYAGGWPVTIESNDIVAPYKWTNLTATVDGTTKKLTLYIDGKESGSVRCNGVIGTVNGEFRIGRGFGERKAGPFNLLAFNGLIDEIEIRDEALTASEIAGFTTDKTADLSIPSSRFGTDLLRPRFHGMPAAGWTNECHGMTYSDGRYHLFFQKNANGPYMARLHWGHISSENLYDWREEKIAIAPGEAYDMKGCWSGCVFSDEKLTGGKPTAIYTAVDYARAVIAQASPVDDSLLEWQKNPTLLVNGRPSGLSDDFRDPYFFRNGDNAYIIVGSSKNGVGTTTLHRYDPATGRWSNDGSLFFTGSNAAMAGSFWEMPNVTKMENGKWLFTATPLNTMQGVRTLYWTGDINADGTFAPDARSAYPRYLELISKDGYGLLSPTIYQKDGKTLMLGIVPDKLPGSKNHELGWAHCYSLPREISLDAEGNLIQKPYEGLKGMRSATGYDKGAHTLSGAEKMEGAEGRHAELLGVFEAGTSAFGFNVFKGSRGECRISINPARSNLTVDMSTLPRTINDAGVYDGVYSCSLPERIKRGDEITLNVFLDGSVLDIFVNNRWTTSIRVFPTADDADGIEAFAEGSVNVKSLMGRTLKSAGQSGFGDIFSDKAAGCGDVYSIDGTLLRRNADSADPLAGLPEGIYVVGGRKMIR